MKHVTGVGRRLLAGAAAPLWLWLLALISVTAFGLLLAYMENYQTSSATAQTQKPSAGQAQSPASKRGEQSGKATDFDFYNLLTDLESIIPERQADSKRNGPAGSGNSAPAARTPSATIPQPASARPAVSSGHYYLQAGAFRDQQAADGRRAELALLNVESAIQKVTIPNRGLWHRVRIGPFRSVPAMRQVRDLLKRNRIESIMIDVKKSR